MHKRSIPLAVISWIFWRLGFHLDRKSVFCPPTSDVSLFLVIILQFNQCSHHLTQGFYLDLIMIYHTLFRSWPIILPCWSRLTCLRIILPCWSRLTCIVRCFRLKNYLGLFILFEHSEDQRVQLNWQMIPDRISSPPNASQIRPTFVPSGHLHLHPNHRDPDHHLILPGTSRHSEQRTACQGFNIPRLAWICAGGPAASPLSGSCFEQQNHVLKHGPGQTHPCQGHPYPTVTRPSTP